MCEAVCVGLRPHVGHGVRGQRNVESRLIRLTRCGLYTCASGDASNDNLRYTVRLELASRSVLAKAPHVRFVTAMSLDR